MLQTEQTKTGEETAQQAWAGSHCREGAEEEGAEKASGGRCFCSVKECSPSKRSRSSIHSALLSSTQSQMHACMLNSGPQLTLSPLLQCLFSSPTEHSVGARHCAKCFPFAIPFCPDDIIRQVPLLHYFIS